MAGSRAWGCLIRLNILDNIPIHRDAQHREDLLTSGFPHTPTGRKAHFRAHATGTPSPVPKQNVSTRTMHPVWYIYILSGLRMEVSRREDRRRLALRVVDVKA